MIEIRTPTEDQRDQVSEVMRVALNLDRPAAEARTSSLALDRFRCAVDGDRVLATAAEHHFRQWFGGAEIPMSGIYGVATLPEHRGTGLATRALEQLLREARDRGVSISTLFPATLRPYRRLGYELAGTMTRHAVPLEHLPSTASVPIEEYRSELLGEVRTCYRRAVASHNGPIDCDDRTWWPERILEHRDPNENFRAVVARGDDGVEGYASFVHEHVQGQLEVEFDLACKHLVASTPRGLRALLAYLRGFRGLGQRVTFYGPPNDPLEMLVDEQRIRPTWMFRWMLRVLDVPGALEARGYAPVSGETVIAVEDPMFEANRGPWRIEADAGKARVTPADAPGSAISIGTLSSIYTGFLRAEDAVRLGLIGDEPAARLLDRLFSGPPPWILDFF